MQLTSKQINHIHDSVLSSYRAQGRSFPRRNTSYPYHILVSEIMLQQTQAVRVVEKYTRFVSILPTLQDLAVVDRTTLLSLRSGLGFNKRGLNLQKCAQAILTQHQGIIPTDPHILITLPGIGPYTSHSIPIFAYNADIVTVDINITRVYHYRLRYFGIIDETTTLYPKDIRTIAYHCRLPGQSRLRHNALMDFGAQVATAKKVGITAPKQKPFSGSIREVRGYILKYLTKQKKQPLTLDHVQHSFPHHDCQAILHTMVAEGLIGYKEGEYFV
ncbi:MAG: hypothetical protein NZL83_03005 [Candidatus Absconditabacterales bacterium]|nr:hypothetical protein [Candidatus Absconditabacterales bacterium]